jgi:AcrR family transcriptional regulator
VLQVQCLIIRGYARVADAHGTDSLYVAKSKIRGRLRSIDCATGIAPQLGLLLAIFPAIRKCRATQGLCDRLRAASRDPHPVTGAPHARPYDLSGTAARASRPLLSTDFGNQLLVGITALSVQLCFTRIHVNTVNVNAPNTATRIAVEARGLLEREGPDAMSMRRVADAVGISATAIYRHYPDRAAVLSKLADQGFEELAVQFERALQSAGSASSRLHKLADVTVDFAITHPRLYELMFLRQRAGARSYPRDFGAGRSPTANRVAQVLDDLSGGKSSKKGWQVAFEIGALSHGLIMLYLGGRIDATVSRFRALHRRALWRYLNAFIP